MTRALVAAAGAALLLAGGAGTRPAQLSNPIQVENAQPGSTGWDARQAPFRRIEGYTSEISVAPGETVQFHVSTVPAAPYRIEIYRLGWYGGLGGRLMGCLPACDSDKPGSPQPVPPFDPATGYLDAGWPVTDTVVVPTAWVSGYYLARLVLTGTPFTSKVPFVVRAPRAAAPSSILVSAPVNTWQAYDTWGGRGLYTRVNGVWTNHVSFNRPFVHGEQDLFEWEIQAVRFLEREGYDLSYATSVDADRDPGELLRHRLFMSIGHDEYWSKGIRDTLEAARDQGTNLAFMGGNTGYWQIRYENDRRTIVEYRIATDDPEPDGSLKTTLFRELNPPRPECELLGVMWQSGIGATGAYAVNSTALSDPYFAHTGFTVDGVAPIIGGEWDGIQPGCNAPPPTVFFHYPGPPAPGDAVRYVAPSGARVFSAGTLRWSWGLDDYGTGQPADPRLQQFTRNALDDLTRPAPPISVRALAIRAGLRVAVRRHPDLRVRGVDVFRRLGRGATLVCSGLAAPCLDRKAPPGRVLRYSAVVRDRWGMSREVLSNPVRSARKRG